MHLFGIGIGRNANKIRNEQKPVKDWKGTCPHTAAVFNYTRPRLAKKVCPSCLRPLGPDHVTPEEWDRMIVDSVIFMLDKET
jgi:hypothetical protein